MNDSFAGVWDAFVQQYIKLSNTENKGLITLYEPEWPSVCVESEAQATQDNALISLSHLSQGDECQWRPTIHSKTPSLANLASALEVTIPSEFEILVGRYFSLDLNAEHARGPLTLLQVWNEQDYDRLQKNLIAHVLMKRRLKQADTLFFALTDEDDIVISLDLETQAVVLEPVGKPAKEVLSDNLFEFITCLKPSPQFVSL